MKVNAITDFLGKELNVGDKVVALSHKRTSSTLYLGEVEKLTDKMVVIKTVGSKHDWRYKETMCVSSYKVVKVNDLVVQGQCKDGDAICPICGMDKYSGLDADIYADWQPKFCPNCGAKMNTKGRFGGDRNV